MFGSMLISRLIRYCGLVVLTLNTIAAFTQDLEKLPDSLYVKMSGGINIGLQAYTSTGMNARRDPFSYLLNANLTFNISDVITMPFSATFSSGSRTFSQPRFGQVGLSPKYKAVTVHAGYRNMQFSPYTLNGISFLGGGVEVAPKDAIWKFKMLVGRFAKGIPFQDDINGKIELPSFERWGWGGMLTLGNKDYSADFILFKATDDHKSVTIPDSLNIAPKENLTFGINTKFKVFDKVSISTEYAGSAFTEDTRMEEIVYDRFTYLNNLGSLFTPRLSSSYNHAFGINVMYSANTYSLGASYRRIDPNYQTLGATYMSNDYQNITINGSKTLLKDRVTLSGNYGLQNNNLDGDKEQATKRIIASIQGTFNVNESWNLSANYSNYSTESNPTYINLIDSVRYAQVAKNMGGMVTYSIASEQVSHSFMLNVMVQNSQMLNNTATEVTQSNTVCKNALLSYTLSFQPLQISLNTSVNATIFEMEDNQTQTIGPVVSIQRPFLDRKMNTSLSYSRMISVVTGNNNSTSVARLNLVYKLFPKHTLKFSVSNTFLARHEKQEDTDAFVKKISNETRFMLNYGMTF